MTSSTTDFDAIDKLFSGRAPQTLDELARLELDELEALYRRGRTPTSLEVLDGSKKGRMLGFSGALSLVDTPLRMLTARAWFPWRGKAFGSDEEELGEGVNRLQLFGERRAFPFDTRIANSALDGQPCILIDYDRPENPWFVRLVRDELRQVHPELFVGPSFFKAAGDPRLWLFFGVSL